MVQNGGLEEVRAALYHKGEGSHATWLQTLGRSLLRTAPQGSSLLPIAGLHHKSIPKNTEYIVLPDTSEHGSFYRGLAQAFWWFVYGKLPDPDTTTNLGDAVRYKVADKIATAEISLDKANRYFKSSPIQGGEFKANASNKLRKIAYAKLLRSFPQEFRTQPIEIHFAQMLLDMNILVVKTTTGGAPNLTNVVPMNNVEVLPKRPALVLLKDGDTYKAVIKIPVGNFRERAGNRQANGTFGNRHNQVWKGLLNTPQHMGPRQKGFQSHLGYHPIVVPATMTKVPNSAGLPIRPPFNLNPKTTGLRTIEVRGNGSCMFLSVAVALYWREHGVELSENDTQKAADELRKELVDHMTAHQASSEEQAWLYTERPRTMTANEYNKLTGNARRTAYLNDMRKRGTWGGYQELYFLQRMLQVNIVLVDEAHRPISHTIPPIPNPKFTIVLEYNGKDHYNPVVRGPAMIRTAANPNSKSASAPGTPQGAAGQRKVVHNANGSVTSGASNAGFVKLTPQNAGAAAGLANLGADANNIRVSAGDEDEDWLAAGSVRQNAAGAGNNGAKKPVSPLVNNGAKNPFLDLVNNGAKNPFLNNLNSARGRMGAVNNRNALRLVANRIAKGEYVPTMNERLRMKELGIPVQRGNTNNTNNTSDDNFVMTQPLTANNTLPAVNALKRESKTHHNGNGNGKAFTSHEVVRKVRVGTWLRVQSKVFGLPATSRNTLCGGANTAWEFLHHVKTVAGTVRNKKTLEIVIEKKNKTVSTEVELGSIIKGMPTTQQGKLSMDTSQVPVLVKRIPLDQEEELLRMHRLSKRVLCTSFPNFPVLYGAVVTKKSGYLALIEAPNGSLATWLLAKSSRSWGEVTNALTQVLLALAALHGDRIAHGAVSPANVGHLDFKHAKAAWWMYRVGDKDVFVRKDQSVFMLMNFGASGTFGEGNVRQQPHCEVAAVIRMFMKPFLGRNALLRMQQLLKIALSTKADAPMFLWNPKVGALLSNEYVRFPRVRAEIKELEGMVGVGDKFNVVPPGYKPHTGKGICTKPGWLASATGSSGKGIGWKNFFRL